MQHATTCCPSTNSSGPRVLASDLAGLRGRSVILVVRDMAKAAASLIDLDGCARRIVLCPPGWELSRLELAARDAQADALVFDGDGDSPQIPVDFSAACRLPLQRLDTPRPASYETEWILPTSGTSGPPKLVIHTLRTLMGAIADAPLQRWATFYDIRRYGGLQIFLRAVSGQGSLSLGADGERVGSLLDRFGAAGVTHISGTPSHWRKVLMSGEGRRIDPEYVRLSGEIADDAVLGALRALYPRARIEHAYASTEAGVALAVDDGRAGFPASLLDGDGDVRLRVVDGSLHVRSNRCALGFLGRARLLWPTRRASSIPATLSIAEGTGSILSGGVEVSSMSAASKFTRKRSRRRSTPTRPCARAGYSRARARSRAPSSLLKWCCAMG